MKMQFFDLLKQYAPMTADAVSPKTESKSDYQYKETRELVQLVNEAADLIHIKGEAAFSDFENAGSLVLYVEPSVNTFPADFRLSACFAGKGASGQVLLPD